MFLLRLARLFFFWILARWVFQSVRHFARRNRKQPAPRDNLNRPAPASKSDYSRLTEQGVDDADFEEIR